MSGSDKSQRRFIAHAAHTSLGVSLPASGVEQHEAAGDWEAPGDGPSLLRVCLVTGASSFDPADPPTTPERFLPTDLGLEYRRVDSECSELEELDECDCLLLLGRADWVSGTALGRIQSHCRRGRPIVVARSVDRPLPAWPAFDLDVLGADYRTSISTGSANKIHVVHRRHPILVDGPPSLGFGSLSKPPRLASDTEVLLTGAAGLLTPVAWTRQYRGGRVFSTVLGSEADFRQRHFPRFLANAILWASQRS